MCDGIYIGSTHQTSRKIINGHFSDILHLIKNGQTSDSFDAYFEQNFKSTISRTDLRK